MSKESTKSEEALERLELRKALKELDQRRHKLTDRTILKRLRAMGFTVDPETIKQIRIMRQKCSGPPPEMTDEEMQRETAAVRENWTEYERRKRAGKMGQYYVVPGARYALPVAWEAEGENEHDPTE
jgi:hypothetical protein